MWRFGSPVPATGTETVAAAVGVVLLAVRAMIAMIPPVLLALLAQRYIVRGLTFGAVKG